MPRAGAAPPENMSSHTIQDSPNRVQCCDPPAVRQAGTRTAGRGDRCHPCICCGDADLTPSACCRGVCSQESRATGVVDWRMTLRLAAAAVFHPGPFRGRSLSGSAVTLPLATTIGQHRPYAIGDRIQAATGSPDTGADRRYGSRLAEPDQLSRCRNCASKCAAGPLSIALPSGVTADTRTPLPAGSTRTRNAWPW